MDSVCPLITCLYSRDSSIVGSRTTLAWCYICSFFASTSMCCAMGYPLFTWCACAIVLYRSVAHGRSYLSPVYWPRRNCFNSSLRFLVYFAIVAAYGGVAWVGVDGVFPLSLVSSSGSTLVGGAVWSFTLGSLELYYFERGWVCG